MADRVFGVETEYGFVPPGGVGPGAGQDRALAALIDGVRQRVPSVGSVRSGLFLSNGSRLYLDCGHHPEAATAEVTNPWDAVRYVLAGDRLLLDAASGAAGRCEGTPTLLRTNVHYASGTTWGLHESVAVSRDVAPQFLEDQLVPFLVTRLYLGAGGFDPRAYGVQFVLSPRAVFIGAARSGESTYNRALFHSKDEPLGRDGCRRLHLICGESLHSEVAAWLRTASLVLVVSLAEGGIDVRGTMGLPDPIATFHELNGRLDFLLPIALADGTTRTPIDIQRMYLEAAEAHADAPFMPGWTRDACRVWRDLLGRAERNPDSLAATVDWSIKRRLFGQHLARRGYTWERVARWSNAIDVAVVALSNRMEESTEDLVALSRGGLCAARFADAAGPLIEDEGLPAAGLLDFLDLRSELFEMDIRFGQLGDGLFCLLDRAGVLDHHMPGVDNIEHAMEHPPHSGRARLRGDVIRRVQDNRAAFVADWEYLFDQSTGAVLDLSNPHETEERWQAEASSTLAGRVGRRPPARPDPWDLRSAALEAVVRGDLEMAESLLQRILAMDFQRASTRVHLARVAWLAGRRTDLRAHVHAAWETRDHADAYVVARAAWFQLLLAMEDGEDTSAWIGRLKSLLRRPTVTMDWTMEPVLTRLRQSLVPEQCRLLDRLVEVMSGREAPATLDELPLWQEAVELPVADEPVSERPACA